LFTEELRNTGQSGFKWVESVAYGGYL